MHHSAETLPKDSEFQKTHRIQASSTPSSIGMEKLHDDEWDKIGTVRDLKNYMEYLEKAPHVVFRHSSSEGIRERLLGDDAGSGLDRVRSEYSIDETAQPFKSITLTWMNLNVTVGEEGRYTKMQRRFRDCCRKQKDPYRELGKEQVRVLKNVNGAALPGRLLAIMGASGAGKTTLLNVLTHRNIGHLSIEGEIKLNGEVVGSRIRTIAAYVQQDDLFIATLKVQEHLMFQARLRLGAKLSQSQRTKRVDEVMAELGLGKCANTLIGGSRTRRSGISGGERKRLAFASEVLTNPLIFFCDEPTSGLDSFMAIQTVEVLKKMAARGKTIVCTIHQPSSQVFELFDDLCLLADGRVAYLGAAKEARRFFEQQGYPVPANFNPADHYIRILAITPTKEKQCRERVKKICRIYNEGGERENVRQILQDASNRAEERKFQEAVKKTSKYKSTWCQQFNALMWRSWIGNLREPLLVPVRLMQTIVISVILGLVYYNTKLEGSTGIQNVTGLIFLFTTNMTFQYFFAVVNVFCEELPIFLREHFSGIYRVDAYFLAKIISELPQYLIFPFLFTVILYFMAGLEPTASVFFVLTGIMILTANVAVSLGYMISCIFADLSIALSVAPAVVIPFMLFAGYYINLDSVPIYFVWLQYLSYFKYSFEAAAINQFQHVENIPGCGANGTCPTDGKGVLDSLSITPDHFSLNLIILAVMIVVIRFIGFLALYIRTRVRKD